MNRIDRLFALVLYLQGAGTATAGEMAGHFGLSVRTIYRDMAALGEAGVPVVAEAGVGYALLRGYRLPPVNFTEEEASALVLGGRLTARLTDASIVSRLDAALCKVRAVLPGGVRDRVAGLERALATTTAAPPSPTELALLQRAVAARRVLRLGYQGAGQAEATSRLVEPHGLIHYCQRWHLIGWCRDKNAFRDFRTDRMRDVEELAETFAPREDFSAEEYIRRTMPRPERTARVRFTPLAADRAKREWWLGVSQEEGAGGEAVVLTLATVDWEPLAGFLLSFGREAAVLAPEALRERLVAMALEAVAHHGEKNGPAS